MDIEVKVIWDQVGSHGADFKPQWVLTNVTPEHEIYQAINTLLQTNTTVTLRDDEIGCTLIYRKKE